MSVFELRKTPPSVRVTKVMLADIEQYIITQGVEISELEKMDIKRKFYIEIIDGFGTESLASVSDINASRFSDSVSCIELRLHLLDQGSLRVFIGFTKDRQSSWIQIKYSGQRARETVMGLYGGILHILNGRKTWAGIFHLPNLFEYSIPVFLLSLLFAMASMFSGEKDYHYTYAYVVVLALFVMYFVCRRMKGFTTFDSRQQRINDGILNWLLSGFLGLVVFGYFFPALWGWLKNISQS